MRYNTDLYELIKSLSKAEKRYFKIYAAQHTKKECNNYILLFDAIDRQEHYNEEKLRYKFRKHTFSKNIAKTKYLLYELIIKMLRQLHNGKSVSSKIKGLIESASYLYSKSLFDQSYTSLLKAKKLAVFFEHHEFWLQILDWEKKLIGNLRKNDSKPDIETLIEDYRRVKTFINLELDYKILLQEIQMYTEYAKQDSIETVLVHFEEIMNTELIVNGEVLAKTFLSKVYFLEIRILYALVIHDYTSAFKALDASYHLWNGSQEKNKIFQEDYIQFCVNYLNCCANAKKKGKFYDELLLNLQYLNTTNAEEADRNFFLASTYDFIYNLTNDNLEVCSIQIFTIKDLIADHKEKLDLYNLITLYYHVSVFYFLKGEYKETLGWIDKIMKENTKCRFSNIQDYCRLLSLMAKYSENEFEVLEYDILKTHRFLSKGKQIKPIEKLILASVKQLLNVKHAKEETSIFNALYVSIHDLYKKDVYPVGLTAGSAIYQWIRNKFPDEDRTLLN